MSSIGPQLPPQLAKRKRIPEDESPDSPRPKTSRPSNRGEITRNDEGSDSDDGYGPSVPKPAVSGPVPPAAIGPALPPTDAAIDPNLPPTASNTDETALGADSDSDEEAGPAPPPPPPSSKPKRVLGPAAPPADLSERPTHDPNTDSDSEDDYGPALPGATRPGIGPSLPGSSSMSGSATAEPTKPRRDDWMLAPPTSTGYRERDPTKIKARKFASGASATSKPKEGGGISSIWTETPEEKARRLKDAVLGRGGGGDQSTAPSSASSRNRGGGESSTENDDKIRAFMEQTRGQSLYEKHQASRTAGSAKSSGKGGEDEDDDPSKRAFDREKDMGLGMKITASQRKELLNRASDFGGRFSKGNYL